MTSQPRRSCLMMALLVWQSLVQGNEQQTKHIQATRTKRDEVATFGSDFTAPHHNDAQSLQSGGSQNLWPNVDLSQADNLATSYGTNDFGKQYDDDKLSFLQLVPQYDTRNLLFSPRDTRSRYKYFHSFVGKRAPEIDNNDRPDLLQLETENENNNDGFDLFRRLAPRFSHNFIGKRQQLDSRNSNPLKRMPVQLFARRAPHYSHSFVGKRSDNGMSYSGYDFPSDAIDDTEVTYPDNYLQTLWFPSSSGDIHQEAGFDNYKPEFPFEFSETPSLHYVVKRASDLEKRGPSFGHSFVGKRAPRFGHSFVGKREREAPEDPEDDLDNTSFEDYVNEQFIPDDDVENGDEEFNSDYSADSGESLMKRQQRPNQNPSKFLGKRPSFTHSFVGKRVPGFGHSFVGKRAPMFGHSFVGKRAPGFGHSFVGKRSSGFGHSFVGKRAPGFGHSFVGKRALGFGHSFVGKRALRFGHSFVGKRAPRFGHSFVGKRASGFSHSFVGKRAPGFGHSFVGKRPGFSHSFVGKRETDSSYILPELPEYDVDFQSQENEEALEGDIFPELAMALVKSTNNTSKEQAGQTKVDLHSNASMDDVKTKEITSEPEKKAPRFGHSFVGKRGPGFGHSFVGKRAPGFGHSFVGKRAPGFGHSFVGKRAPGFGHSFVGKRAPGFGHSFVGKRAPGFGHSFVGKRAPGFGHSFVGKRAPGFGHSFVGKRAPGFGHSFVGKRAPGFGHSFVGKRAPRFGHSFVGKRDDVPIADEDTVIEDNLTPQDAVQLMELIDSDDSSKDQTADSGDNNKNSKTSNM